MEEATATISLADISGKIKQEKLTPPPSPKQESSITAAVDVKTDITPIKSSNELLDELFKAFSAVVPESILSNPAPEISRKKHKKEKKSKKSKHKERKSDDDAADEPKTDDHHHKRVKVKKEKRSKKDKPDKDRIAIDDKAIDPKSKEIKVKTEKRRIGYPDAEDDQLGRHKRIKLERSRSKERTIKVSKHTDSDKNEKLTYSLKSKPAKIVIKSLKDSTVIRDAEENNKKRSSRQHHPNHHHHHHHFERRHRDGNGSDDSEISLSDEETYLLERSQNIEYDRRKDRHDRKRGRSRDRSSRRSSDRHPERCDQRRSERGENRFYASRER